MLASAGREAVRTRQEAIGAPANDSVERRLGIVSLTRLHHAWPILRAVGLGLGVLLSIPIWNPGVLIWILEAFHLRALASALEIAAGAMLFGIVIIAVAAGIWSLVGPDPPPDDDPWASIAERQWKTACRAADREALRAGWAFVGAAAVTAWAILSYASNPIWRGPLWEWAWPWGIATDLVQLTAWFGWIPSGLLFCRWLGAHDDAVRMQQAPPPRLHGGGPAS